MHKCWRLPRWHSKWKLEKRRTEALSEIIGERLDVEAMAQRPRSADDSIDSALLEKTLERLKHIENSAKVAREIDDLDDLIDDAEQQGQFRGYLCPLTEIRDEAELVVLDLVEEWGVPKTKIQNLRTLFDKKLEEAKTNPTEARSALRALFQEKDSWWDYTDEYEETIQRYTYRLVLAIIILLPPAVLAIHFASWFQPLLVAGLLFAGVVGSCVSVLANKQMPATDIRLSAELEAYGRRILTRIAVGGVASLIGSALFGWLPIVVGFGEAVTACTKSPPTCTGIQSLLLLGIPVLLGFSERTLTSLERRVFGTSQPEQDNQSA